jgi:esterase/lipase
VKEKTEELLVKQLKSFERNMQELTNSIKRPNLTIIGIEEEEVQAKGICNIFLKIIQKFSKSPESFAHSGKGSLQDTKKT